MSSNKQWKWIWTIVRRLWLFFWTLYSSSFLCLKVQNVALCNPFCILKLWGNYNTRIAPSSCIIVSVHMKGFPGVAGNPGQAGSPGAPVDHHFSYYYYFSFYSPYSQTHFEFLTYWKESFVTSTGSPRKARSRRDPWSSWGEGKQISLFWFCVRNTDFLYQLPLWTVVFYSKDHIKKECVE